MRKSHPPTATRKDSGSISLLLLGATLVFVGALFGVAMLVRHYRNEVEAQLRIDRCAAQTAVALVRTQNQIGVQNAGIIALRAAAKAAQALPGAIAVPETGLAVLVAAQDLELAHWQSRQLQWLIAKGCDHENDTITRLPSLQWERSPPDDLGPPLGKHLERLPSCHVGQHDDSSPREARRGPGRRGSFLESTLESHWEALRAHWY